MSADDTYYRVGTRIWLEPWSEDAQRVALYLLTCRHRNTEGIYRLPVAYASTDLRWKPRRYETALAELARDGFIKWDAKASVVFIVNALKWQAPGTTNHITGAIRRLREVPATPLWDDFWMQAERHASGLANRKREVMGDA